MKQATARAIEQHKLTIIQVRDYEVYVGKLLSPDMGYGDGVHAHLRYHNPECQDEFPRQARAWGYSEGRNVDSAVEDWCNAHNLPYKED